MAHGRSYHGVSECSLCTLPAANRQPGTIVTRLSHRHGPLVERRNGYLNVTMLQSRFSVIECSESTLRQGLGAGAVQFWGWCGAILRIPIHDAINAAAAQPEVLALEYKICLI